MPDQSRKAFCSIFLQSQAGQTVSPTSLRRNGRLAESVSHESRCRGKYIEVKIADRCWTFTSQEPGKSPFRRGFEGLGINILRSARSLMAQAKAIATRMRDEIARNKGINEADEALCFLCG